MLYSYRREAYIACYVSTRAQMMMPLLDPARYVRVSITEVLICLTLLYRMIQEKFQTYDIYDIKIYIFDIDDRLFIFLNSVKCKLPAIFDFQIISSLLYACKSEQRES